MRIKKSLITLLMLLAMVCRGQDYVPRDYVWTTQSKNSSGSMPCGGHDIGMNVWVENGEILFYISQSGWFDENNTLLKAGRWRIHFDDMPFDGDDFVQRLCLDDGAVYVSGGGKEVRIWVDVDEPIVFVMINSRTTEKNGSAGKSGKGKREGETIAKSDEHGVTVSYESWRYQDRELTKAECQQCSYKWVLPKGSVTYGDGGLPLSGLPLSPSEGGGKEMGISAMGATGIGNDNKKDCVLRFWHKNKEVTVFDYTVEREHLTAIKDSLYNPLGGRLMEGRMYAPGFRFTGTSDGTYASTDYRAWNFRKEDVNKKTTIAIELEAPLLSHGDKAPLLSPEGEGLKAGKGGRHDRKGARLDQKGLTFDGKGAEVSRKRSARWWHAYWQRSWITTDGSNADAARVVRNYELMRYMLGCNAYGAWPTKFNGGLFTFDPVYVEGPDEKGEAKNAFTPDYRKWGGGTMTAQNQRLVYWPMLKSGDYDMLHSQLDTYLRLLPTATARTRHYWGHGGASYTEQLENFGLPNPAEYGKHPEGSDYGVERNAWLEYEWDTALEFCMMALQAAQYDPEHRTDYDRYHPMVTECLRFFDEHYQYRAKQLGAKALDGDGRLILYPGSGCETYKMAYNPSSTIAALKAVVTAFPQSPLPLDRIPDIPLRVIDGDTCIAPAVTWARIQNVETPQLYPVFPWRIYGMGRPGLDIARNTYLKDPHAVAMRSSKGWKQDLIWAACLGLTDEARQLCIEKFADGPYRFPAFWDPGFDWSPDLNRGGAAMIGLQEMLLQEMPDGELLLLPAWPKEWPVRFKLHATGGRVVEH